MSILAADIMNELRALYLGDARQRLTELDALLLALDRDPNDADTLEETRRRFHGFAGSGRTHGFARVTELGQDGERACALWRSENVAPDTEARRRLRTLSAQIASELQASPAPAAEAAASDASEGAGVALVVGGQLSGSGLDAWIAREGLTVRCVATVAEAQDAVRRLAPRVVITEHVLPDGSGLQLLRGRSAGRSGRRAAAIVVGDGADFRQRLEAARDGVDAWFERPVEPAAVLARVRQLLERQSASAARVLCVEDDAVQAAFLRTVLESAGYEFRHCAAPHELEAEVARFPPDLVLMDVRLPEASGLDLARWLRQQERHATLPILLLTTETEMETRLDGERCGADEFLAKPVSPSLLLTTVGARLERARMLRELIERDGLTRLLTHTAFAGRARDVWDRCRQEPERGACWVMIDLDRFKAINDTHGHPAGDQVLVALANLLRARLRRSDIVGRYGGEEFAIVFDGATAADVAARVGALLEEFRRLGHASPNGSSFEATFSAGVAGLRPQMTFEAWGQAADDALYAAKRGGRQRVVTR